MRAHVPLVGVRCASFVPVLAFRACVPALVDAPRVHPRFYERKPSSLRMLTGDRSSR